MFFNKMNKYFISCDWGTTTFRLRLVETETQEVLSEVITNEGIAPTFAAWKTTQNDRQLFFKEKLKLQITALEKQSKKSLADVDIIVSGMAASSIGLLELPYAALPFDLNGSQTTTHILEADADFPNKIILISGLRSESDVMRGEETQVIGLMELLKLSAEKDFILILPGTHSKHIYLKNNILTGFQTYMTGEMFSIISNHSILKDSIILRGADAFSATELAAFKKGVGEAVTSDLLKNLFKVRTNQLLHQWDKIENGLYLSALLIGSELKNLLTETDATLVLCSGNHLFELYKMALEVLGLSERILCVPPEIIDKSVVVGQVSILQNNKTL